MSKQSLIKKLGIKYPIIQSPMAGVSTIEMSSSITNKGGLGSIPLSTINFIRQDSIRKLNDIIDKYKSQLNDTQRVNIVNLNFFCHDIVSGPNTKQTENWKNLYNTTINSQDNFEVKELINDIEFQNGNVSFKEFEQNKDQFQILLDYLVSINPKIISFHFGIPLKQTIEFLQKHEIMIFITATSLAEVIKLLEYGIDGIILQGSEAGGHRGNFLSSDYQDEYLTTKALFLKTKEYFKTRSIEKIPYLVPSGGIMNTDTINWYLNQGADAVQLGTIFLSTPESTTSTFFNNYNPLESDTIMTNLISGKNARCINTKFITTLTNNYYEKQENLPGYGYSYYGYKKLKTQIDPALEDIGFYLCGLNHFQIKQGKTTNEIMDELIKDLKY
ncbi:hypothetical protein KGF54_005596 [Candida jiufengensis]|uniref:uncharacterized protein n=1 Tax=Candida jiufengensis TaxID=497108 RepID=UPI0022250759|nr:uncharacterized protein KGF54_005596 [Candida jiufengensis]KAI5949361.1 hypothetical protein KGF54_005596 [Candida jiufengensis]